MRQDENDDLNEEKKNATRLENKYARKIDLSPQ